MATQGCPCGFLGHPRRPCKCTPHQIKLYRGRLSGPLLDRIDLHVEVPAVTARELMRGMGRGRARADPDVSGGGAANICTPERNRVAEGGATIEPSAVIRARVESARETQRRRFCGPGSNGGNGSALIHCNAQMGIPEIETFCRCDDPTRAFLQKAVESLSLSARSAHRALRVARTIADLAACAEIQLEHVAEAVQYQALSHAEAAG